MAEPDWEIRWTDRADLDLGQAIAFDESRGMPSERWLRALFGRVALLAGQPEMGSPVRFAGQPTQYRRLISGVFSIYYTTEPVERVVFVVRVWHSSRNPADLTLE